MTLEDLEVKRVKFEAICRRYQVQKLDIFGSVATGEARVDSDVDSRVFFDPNEWITLYDLMDLRRGLLEVIGIEVDISEEVPPRNPYFARGLAPSRRSFFAA